MLRQRGFSLLEVLVAFVILSLTLGVLFQVFATGLRNSALSEEYTHAALHAESILAGLGRETPLEEGEQQGEINDRYRWRTRISLYQDADLELESLSVIPYWLRVEVFWQERSVVLESLRLASAEDVDLRGLGDQLRGDVLQPRIGP